jgi:fumarate reductase flavoprotein subunit
LLQTLAYNFGKRGGKILRGTRALNLIMENRRCVGVEAEADGVRVHYGAGATVLCDGGFQANADLVRENIMKHPEKLRQRGAATGAGDGLRMAREVGAATAGLDCFYGHPLSIDALTNNKLWPYPYLDVLCSAGVVVNAEGWRFTDEGMSGVYTANHIARLADPLSAQVVYDSAIWEGPGRHALIAPNPHVRQAGGTIHTADDLDTLAALMRVPAAALKETIATYNAAVDAETCAQLSPPRRVDRYKPFAIRKPPFYAIPLCIGITYTMGGIAIDKDARVMDGGGAPIVGLFAAGATTGGLEGGPAIGYVGGLTKASTLGYRAAEKIAADIKS